MADEKHTRGAPVVEDRDMETVELHRAQSMVNENIEILDQINDRSSSKPPLEGNAAVYHYVGNKAKDLGNILSQISVELVMFLYMFSYILRNITSTTMIIQKVCLFHLSYDEDTCSHLKDHPAIKSEVEKMANTLHLGHSMLSMIPSAILAIFIGSWSDKYGRKFPIICALVGVIVDGFGISLCAYFFKSRVQYIYISAVFVGLSGGFISVLMVLYAYASDVTALNKRTMKYAFMEVAFAISMPLGALVGGWLFKFTGYVPVFMTSTCGHMLALFYVLFFMEETRGLDNTDTWRQKFANFWTFQSLVSSFRATAKKRPNQGRRQIWILIVAMSINVFSFAATAGIIFIYVHHRFDWENTTYSTISAVYSVIGLVLLLVIVPVAKRMKVGDPALGIAGTVSLILKNIGTGLASKTWIYHVASLGGLVASLATLAARSRISKLVSKDELGKVFAFTQSAESIFPIVATAVVSQLFNLTLDEFPGLIFVVMGGLGFISLAVFIYIARLPHVNYEEMNDEERQEEEVQVKDDEVSPSKY